MAPKYGAVIGVALAFTSLCLLRTTLKEPRRLQVKSLSITNKRTKSGAVGVALMIGFPWSGQNFIQRAVQEMTQTSTANNYGQGLMVSANDNVVLYDARDSIPLYEGNHNGPFAFSDILPFPTSGHVLTRSYCAGHCKKWCTPDEYIVGSHQFYVECYNGAEYTEGGGEKITRYSPQLVTKYIHLIRNPFTQIAARYEHVRDVYESQGNEKHTDRFQGGADGFHDWCRQYDDRYQDNFELEKKHFLVEKDIEFIAMGVPCHSDFYRLIQWHNNAFDLSLKRLKDKPFKFVYYEDLEANPDEVMRNLLKYLELKPVSERKCRQQWYEQATNPPYYYENEFELIKKYVQYLATPVTWDHIKRYFV